MYVFNLVESRDWNLIPILNRRHILPCLFTGSYLFTSFTSHIYVLTYDKSEFFFL